MRRSTLQLLRFHFSLFLLPVFLFALSQQPRIDRTAALLAFFILHILVYPASNGYNSYMDRDETPIGGLEKPLAPTRQLFFTTVAMDLAALCLSLFLGWRFTLGIAAYILASRAYSYRGIRLKRFAVTGFFTVFIFQGFAIFWITWQGVHPSGSTAVPLLPAFISSLLIGALYPLTQIYQHEADRADGVSTISMVVGKRGSFLLSGGMFGLASLLLFVYFNSRGQSNQFRLYLLMLGPVVLFFLYWMRRVWIRPEAADFRNSLRMNLLSTLCTTAYFITLIVLNH